jgi:hypothetical protein
VAQVAINMLKRIDEEGYQLYTNNLSLKIKLFPTQIEKKFFWQAVMSTNSLFY